VKSGQCEDWAVICGGGRYTIYTGKSLDWKMCREGRISFGGRIEFYGCVWKN